MRFVRRTVLSAATAGVVSILMLLLGGAAAAAPAAPSQSDRCPVVWQDNSFGFDEVVENPCGIPTQAYVICEPSWFGGVPHRLYGTIVTGLGKSETPACRGWAYEDGEGYTVGVARSN